MPSTESITRLLRSCPSWSSLPTAFEERLEREYYETVKRPSLWKIRMAALIVFTLLFLHLYSFVTNKTPWQYWSTFFSRVIYVVDVFLAGLVAVSLIWTERHPTTKLDHVEQRLVDMIALGVFLYPMSDRWHLPRIMKDDMFQIYKQDQFDDTMLIFGLVATMTCVFIFPFSSKHSLKIPAAGCFSYTFLTLLTGSPESSPFIRTQYFKDVIMVVMMNFVCFMSWFGSLQMEKYVRHQFMVVRDSRQRLAVTEMSLKGYIDAWAILKGDQILEASPVLEEILGIKPQGSCMTDLLLQSDKPRLANFLTEIQMYSRCQKINLTFNTVADGPWEVEAFGVHSDDGRIHIAMKSQFQCQALDAPETEDFIIDAMAPDELIVPEDDCCENNPVMLETHHDTRSMVSGRSSGSARIFSSYLSAVIDKSQMNLGVLTVLGLKEHWLLDNKAVSFNDSPERLGRGGFGTVVKGWLAGGAVAVKFPHSSKNQGGKFLASIANELRVLRHVRHPNIVLFHGALTDSTDISVALVFEFIAGMQLHDYVSAENFNLDMSAKTHILLDITCALWYLHLVPVIVHGDLKSANIMIEHGLVKPRTKLLDFGLSAIKDESNMNFTGGTLRWSAPEKLDKSSRTTEASVDIYSVGLIMYLVFTTKQPLKDLRQDQFRAAARARCLPTPLWPPKKSVEGFHTLALRCCSRFPGNRPHAEAIHAELVSLLSETGLQVSTERLQQTIQPSSGATLMRDLPMPEDTLERPLHCWINSVDRAFPVLCFTPDFGKCCGLFSKETPLLADWVSDQHAFEVWLNMSANNNTHSSGHEGFSALHVVLRPPSLYSSGKELHAQCILDTERKCLLGEEEFQVSLTAEQEEEDPLLIHVSFHHVRLQQLPHPPSIG